MTKWLRISLLLAMFVLVLSVIAGRACKAQPPASLDTLWEKHMLAGTFVVMDVHDSRIDAEEVKPRSVEPVENFKISGALMSHPISVMKLGEGFFKNGGWVLTGGLLRRIRDTRDIFELYVKEVKQRFSYIPFPPHRDIPEEIGYEFFLVHRNPEVAGAQIVRKWVFKPDKVKNPSDPFVQANLRYDKKTRIATLEITGLKQPFEEHADLSMVR